MNDIKKIQEFFSKSLEEATFKVGDKVTYLGHPGEITGINKEMTGAITYNVAYDKGNGRTKATNIDLKSGAIKLAEAEEKYTVAGHSVTLNKGKKTDGTDWTVTFKNGKSKPLSDVLALIKPMPKGITMNEAKEETGVDMAKKQLDALGVKYEMSKTDKVRPFKVIYRPINKSDKFYDEFEDIVDLFNLKGFVKSSIKENNSIDYTKLISLIKSANNPRNLPIYYNSDNGVVNIGGVGYDKGELVKMFNSQPGQSLDIKNLFYKANQNPEETKNAIESMDPSIKVEIGYGYGNEPFVKYIKALMNEDFAKFDTLKMAINQHEKGEPYYDKTRLINIFNQLDNPDQERAKKEYSEYFGKSVNESNGFKSGKEFINIKLQKYPKAVAKINQLIDMIGEDKFTMEMAMWIIDFFNNASYESPVNEAKSISDYKVGDVISFKDGEDWKVMKVKDNVGKLVIKPYNEKAKKGNVSLEIDIDADYLKNNLSEATKDEETTFHTKLDKLVHDTFGKRKDELEEGAVEIMDAYNRILDLLKKESRALNDDDSYALGLKLRAWFEKNIIKETVDENELTEAYVPSNIAEFAKRRGVSSLVRKVAGWAEKVGARIAGGTAIGKNYSTLVLDLDYKQQGEIRIDTDEETIELYDEPVYDFKSFQRVYIDGQDNNEIDEVKATIKFIKESNPEATTEEVIAELKEIKKLGQQLNEELCPAGKAYIKRRQAAGEKSSAYLSGRGVKVCKGQMSGRKKKK
jgi:major membrane immunogen (membrane-anchored lipoprotein)